MSSSRVHCMRTGAPTSRESHAASQMKSGFDFRPKPPPSNVTLTVTFEVSTPRYFVNDLMLHCLYFTRPHAPLLRGGILEQCSHCCAGLAVLHEEEADAARPIRVLRAILLLVTNGLLDGAACPIRLHLVGDDVRQR